MPTPRKGEEKDAFMKRCMAHPHTQKYMPDQRVAVCSSLYEEAKKKRQSLIADWGTQRGLTEEQIDAIAQRGADGKNDAQVQSLRAFIRSLDEDDKASRQD